MDQEWAKAYEPFGAGEITLFDGGKKKDSPEVAARKRESIAAREVVDGKVLGALLSLNGKRAGVQIARGKGVKPQHKAKEVEVVVTGKDARATKKK